MKSLIIIWSVAILTAIGTFVYIDRSINDMVREASIEVPAERGETTLKVTTEANYIKHRPAQLQLAMPDSSIKQYNPQDSKQVQTTADYKVLREGSFDVQ